jgi:nucleoside 2-deoxyribosyltransferase
MKIYFACTVRGDRSAVASLRAAAARLQSHGHDVLTEHLLCDDVEARESALTERDVFERDIRWLDECDALVADASGSSFGVGFEVGYVLARAPRTGQHVYLIYDETRAHQISRLIVGASGPHCSRLAYRSPADLLAFIDAHFSGRLSSADTTR